LPRSRNRRAIDAIAVAGGYGPETITGVSVFGGTGSESSATEVRSVHRMLRRGALWYVLAVSLLCPTCAGARTHETKPIAVALRYDDYSNVSPIEIERKMFEVLQSLGLHCMVSVVPFTYSSAEGSPITYPAGRPLGAKNPLEDIKATLLRQYIASGTIEVAQHGYAHRALRRWRGVSEFAGVDPTTQKSEIGQGKNLLERLTAYPVNLFVPPFDSYDTATLDVLEGLGFTVLSASRGGTCRSDGRIRFVPWTTRLEQLKPAIEEARRSPDPAPAVVVIFHPFDFVEVNRTIGKITFPDFVKLLYWLSAQPDVREEPVGELAKADFSAATFMANRWPFYLESNLGPPFLSGWDVTGTERVYVSASTVDAVLYKAISFDAAYYLLVLLFVSGIAIGATNLARSGERFLRLSRSVLAVGALALAAYVFRNGRPLFLGASVLTCVAGAALGLEMALLRRGAARHDR
jgi:Uncharacterized protein conserved in bacteria (DUF2334)